MDHEQLEKMAVEHALYYKEPHPISTEGPHTKEFWLRKWSFFAGYLKAVSDQNGMCSPMYCDPSVGSFCRACEKERLLDE